NSYDNIQPRLGIAYRLTNKTVLRTSFGRFFDNWAAVLQMAQNQQGTWPSTGQFIETFNQNAAPPTVLAENPLQGANTTPLPTPYDISAGKAWYHALQVSLDKKASHGLSYLLSYTWSKTLDIGADEWFGTGTNGTSVQNAYNLSADKGLAGFDVPQIFTGSWV